MGFEWPITDTRTMSMLIYTLSVHMINSNYESLPTEHIELVKNLAWHILTKYCYIPSSFHTVQPRPYAIMPPAVECHQRCLHRESCHEFGLQRLPFQHCEWLALLLQSG